MALLPLQNGSGLQENDFGSLLLNLLAKRSISGETDILHK